MLKHFAKLGSPLRTVLKYPGNHAQSQRFFAAGFQNVESQNLWELWSSPTFLSPSQRMALDHIEPFDEWEEFALFASHYTFLTAQTEVPTSTRRRRESGASLASDLSTRTASPIRYGNQWFAYKYSPNPAGDGWTHHGAGFPIRGEDAVAVHGGVGLQGRLKTTFVHATSHFSRVSDLLLPPANIAARSSHTITTLGNDEKVLIGGRGSPGAPMSDCWILRDNAWERIQDLPAPRYRHRSVAVTLPGDNW